MAAQSAAQTERSAIGWLFGAPQNLFLWHAGSLSSCHHGNTAEDNTVLSMAITQVSDWDWSAMVQGESFPGADSAAAAEGGGAVWCWELQHDNSLETCYTNQPETGLIQPAQNQPLVC